MNNSIYLFLCMFLIRKVCLVTFLNVKYQGQLSFYGSQTFLRFFLLLYMYGSMKKEMMGRHLFEIGFENEYSDEISPLKLYSKISQVIQIKIRKRFFFVFFLSRRKRLNTFQTYTRHLHCRFTAGEN